MQLIDPTATNPTQNHQLAPRLSELQGKRIGLLCNGKANARSLLLKTAELFRVHDQCEIDSELVFKICLLRSTQVHPQKMASSLSWPLAVIS